MGGTAPVVGVGVREGNALGNAWRHVLRAVSRYDHLYSLATGYDDASLFEVEGSPNGGGPAGGPERGAPPALVTVFGRPMVVPAADDDDWRRSLL